MIFEQIDRYNIQIAILIVTLCHIKFKPWCSKLP